MQEDMSVFGTDGKATFINRVIENFHDQAKASCDRYLRNLEKEMIRLYSDGGLTGEARDAAVRIYLDRERNCLMEAVKEQSRNKAHTALYRINNANAEYLSGEECGEDRFYGDLGLYLKCLLEEYAGLPYIEREKIYFKDFYDKIEMAIAYSQMLKVHRADGVLFYVYPYKLMEDTLSTRYYLACYTKRERTGADKHLASLRVSRLKDVRVLRESGRLNKEEVRELEKAIAARSVQFLVDNEEEIHVRLTDVGIRKYRQQLYLRPAKDSVLSDGYTYVFHCTQFQAEVYFLKFGKEAQILKPQSLRERFQRMYAEALDSYQ